MFSQINSLLNQGTTITLVISKAGDNLQVITHVKAPDSAQLTSGTFLLKGKPDEMESALLEVLQSKSEAIETLQSQVAAAKEADKKVVAAALSTNASSNDFGSTDDEDSDLDSEQESNASTSKPAVTQQKNAGSDSQTISLF